LKEKEDKKRKSINQSLDANQMSETYQEQISLLSQDISKSYETIAILKKEKGELVQLIQAMKKNLKQLRKIFLGTIKQNKDLRNNKQFGESSEEEVSINNSLSQDAISVDKEYKTMEKEKSIMESCIT